MRSAFVLYIAWFCLWCANVATAGDGNGQAPDLRAGERVYGGECANCHGEKGQGGDSGGYPRIAGLPVGYIGQQLRAFRDRDRKRQNTPMIPIFKSGGLRDVHINDVASYLTGLPVPPATELKVPVEPTGDLEFGEELYVTDCALCHGFDGKGKGNTDNSPVVQQYPSYVIKRMADFPNGKRWHECGEQLFGEAEADEVDAMVGYILHLNQNPPVR